MAFRHSEDPGRHVFDRLSKPVFSHVGPTVHEEIRVGLELCEFDAGMQQLEGRLEMAAAVAHKFHLGLVSPFAVNECCSIYESFPDACTAHPMG